MPKWLFRWCLVSACVGAVILIGWASWYTEPGTLWERFLDWSGLQRAISGC
jgi:hypothetical protein